MARKPILTSIEYEARFPVKARVLQAILCECEAEGELRVRVARDPTLGWTYDASNPDTYLDVHAYDVGDAYLKARAGEWIEGTVSCYGCLKKVWTSKIEMDTDVLASGTRLTGETHIEESRVDVDFGIFHAGLEFEGAEQMRRVLAREGIKGGAYVQTEVEVEISARRWGTRNAILGRARH